MLSHQEVVRDFTESGLSRMAGMMAAVFPFAALIQVLATTGNYRQPAVACGIWLAVLAAAAWFVPRIRAGGLAGRAAAVAVLITVAAVAAIGWEHRAYYPSGSVDMAISGTVWLLALVALSHRARIWAPAALIVFAVHAALLIRIAGLNPLSLSQLEAAGYILVVMLGSFAVLQPTVAMHISMATRRACLASSSVAERAAAAAVQEDRRIRLALLEMEALPLLRGIAEGTLDPAAGDVRERCARHAAALRHSLTDRGPNDGGLLAALQPALRVASARGLLVKVQVIGDPGVLSPGVARAAAAAVDSVLGGLPPHQVMLSVLACGDDSELYLTFSEPLRVAPDVAGFGRDVPAAARWHAALTVEEDGAGCLEISWRKAACVDRHH
ncbi:MAG: hypothetical protein ACRDPY_19085 [Streptosporangiaceae bacterium]